MSEKPRKSSRVLLGISLSIFICAVATIIYDVFWGHFLFNKGYGPGAYYFTDVPGWQHVFLDSPYLGFQHPIGAAIFFIGWALLMFKLLCYLNDRL